jgi:hypothetical protein
MSKMRSENRARLALALGLAAFGLAGCGRVDVHSPQVRGTGYFRMEDVIKHHPLYAQVAQLTDAIDTIGLQASAPQAPKTAAEIAAATAQLNRSLRDAQNRTNAIIAHDQEQYAAKERAAIAAALRAAGQTQAANALAGQVGSTSAQQAAQIAAQANQNFMQYQQSVIAQNNQAAASISQQLQIEADRQLRARAEQYQQSETDLSFQLSQQNASQRLALKTKLSNLALDDAGRAQLESQLNGLQQKQNDAELALHDRNQAALAQYRAQLRAQTDAAIAARVGDVQAQTRSQLESRRNEVGAQLRDLGPSQVEPDVSPAVKQQLQQIHQRFATAFQTDAQKAVSDYQAVKADLDRQYAALHGADVGATGAAAQQLASLERRRDDLTKQMQAQIVAEADRIGKQQGFQVVFINVNTAVGGYDMTDELTKDIEGLHQ